MTDIIEMQNEVRKYFFTKRKMKTQEKYIGVEFKKIGGLSNVNYIAVVKDMSTNEKIAQVLYRKKVSVLNFYMKSPMANID